jgi:hypothetical protein
MRANRNQTVKNCYEIFHFHQGLKPVGTGCELPRVTQHLLSQYIAASISDSPIPGPDLAAEEMGSDTINFIAYFLDRCLELLTAQYLMVSDPIIIIT